MGKIFSFCNQKGGVGKTTSVINVAACLGEFGLNGLVVDMDPQGNATSGFGEDKPGLESTAYQLLVENSEPREIIQKTKTKGIDLIRANYDLAGLELDLAPQERREFRLKETLKKVKDEYDFVFIDCPPSLGLITVNSLVASDYIFIPLQCEYYALEGLGQLLQTYQLVKDNLNPGLEVGGVLLTMADFRTNLTQQVVEEVKSHFADKVFQSIIPRSVKLSEAPSFGQPAIYYDPHNKGSIGYRLAGEEFRKIFFGEKSPKVSKVRNQTEGAAS